MQMELPLSPQTDLGPFYAEAQREEFARAGISKTAIAIWMRSAFFPRPNHTFRISPPLSLLSCQSRAFLYHCVVSLRPERVLEIGTYRAGTAEVIARAMREADA